MTERSSSAFRPAKNKGQILISSTKGADPARVSAIAVVSGVGPLLQNNQAGRATAVSLGAMSLGGLASAVQAMAGPSAGPNGGQIFIDGFTGGRMPPKESIREVRINQNPFNAENNGIGFGQIEIFTKPGADKLRGWRTQKTDEQGLLTLRKLRSGQRENGY